MTLTVFRALWGMDEPIEQSLERILEAGYDGVEIWTASFPELAISELKRRLDRYPLKVIVSGAIAETSMLERGLYEFAEYHPVKINIQSGRDNMTPDEGCTFFEEALRVEDRLGIPVGHETHRGKILFTPWTTQYYLSRFDALKITADYSHWVNVCERLPEDQSAALALANHHAIHIHGRVGYEEGPQVPDPSAPEYADQLAWHERQWQSILDNLRQRGDIELTFTPEYGPPMYLHTLPHTNVPVANLWEVCLWAAQRARTALKA